MSKRSTQKKVVNKKNTTTHISIWLGVCAVVLLGVVIFLLMKEKPSDSIVKNRTQQVSTPEVDTANVQVPPPMEIVHNFKSVESLPEITPNQLRASADVILKLEDSPFLQTKDDHEIFALLKEYVEGKRVIHWTLDSRPLVSTGVAASAVMAFNCVDQNPGDSFGVGPVQWNTEIVALVFYHELKHAVDCHTYEQKHGVRRDPDDVSRENSELVAYAAQVRFFVALYHSDMLPKVVSGSPYGDFGILGNMQQVWQALLEKRFGQWYKQASAATAPKEIDKEVYKRIGP